MPDLTPHPQAARPQSGSWQGAQTFSQYLYTSFQVPVSPADAARAPQDQNFPSLVADSCWSHPGEPVEELQEASPRLWLAPVCHRRGKGRATHEWQHPTGPAEPCSWESVDPGLLWLCLALYNEGRDLARSQLPASAGRGGAGRTRARAHKEPSQGGRWRGWG